MRSVGDNHSDELANHLSRQTDKRQLADSGFRLKGRAALAINLALHPDEPDGGARTGLWAFWAAGGASHQPCAPSGRAGWGRAHWPVGILGSARRWPSTLRSIRTSRMGAIALARGHFGRRAAVAINLALHPDEPDWGRVWWPICVLARHRSRGSYSGSTQGTRHTPVDAVSRDWKKSGNQPVLAYAF